MRNEKRYDESCWKKDGKFSAYPGQEVTKSIWEHMLNCVFPKTLPQAAADDAKILLGFPVFGGFLMGEANDMTMEGKETYLAFTNKGERYYYLGKYAVTGERQYGKLYTISKKSGMIFLLITRKSM